jgi:hypothetical protein
MGSKKTYPAINYTARDFNSIKEELVDYAKRYYSDTFQDFNDAGFGALMLDTTAYIGDILSFYVDYSANESFLNTALEYENILKLGKQMGYRFRGRASSFGIASLFIVVPANSTGLGPDTDYVPILKRGTTIPSNEGALFVLNEDVDFSNSSNEVVVARANDNTGVPTHYAIKSSGQVISGEVKEKIVEVGSFEKFRTIEILDNSLTQVISVVDSDGHEYYEVDYLSQDVIFRAVTNRDDSSREKAPNLLKPVVVPRRFTTDQQRDTTILQFGAGSERSTTADPLIDPSTTVLNFYARDYVTDTSFDPSNLLGTDKLGISPSNTTLRIAYRANSVSSVNVSANGLASVADPILQFKNINGLNNTTISEVRDSLEVSNEDPISGDVSFPTTKELKIRINDVFASQNRAVTSLDYRAIAYQMPPEFGAVKRANVYRDLDANKRNLNMYVISEDSDGNLETTNSTIKQNLKTWLNQSRMINDTVDILDAKIVNVGIEFVVVGDLEGNKFQTLNDASVALESAYEQKLEIGEPFFITDVYGTLNSVPGVVDTVSVKLIQKKDGLYSTTHFDLDSAISPDGRFLSVPENVILEIKYPDDDIRGSVK